MGFVQAIPEIEAWLDADASSWSFLPDQEYKTLVRRWSECFIPHIAAGPSCFQGLDAIRSLEFRLPATVVLFNGFQVRRFANLGGGKASAYSAIGLRRLNRGLANRMELILAADDFAWSCIFSHEAGAPVKEQLYER